MIVLAQLAGITTYNCLLDSQILLDFTDLTTYRCLTLVTHVFESKVETGFAQVVSLSLSTSTGGFKDHQLGVFAYTEGDQHQDYGRNGL